MPEAQEVVAAVMIGEIAAIRPDVAVVVVVAAEETSEFSSTWYLLIRTNCM